MLALDPNDPNQACLMAGGDCINEIVQRAVLDLEAATKGFRSAIPAIVDQMAKMHDLHPHFVWFALFRPKQWPPMSAQDKKMLMLSQQVFEASGAWRPSSLNPFTGNPGWSIPEDLRQVDQMFKSLVKAIRKLVYKPLLRKWVQISKGAVRDIQGKCEESFGVPVSAEDAADLLYGDLTRMVLHNRVPGKHPNLIPALLDL